MVGITSDEQLMNNKNIDSQSESILPQRAGAFKSSRRWNCSM